MRTHSVFYTVDIHFPDSEIALSQSKQNTKQI
nr:hypothetical protein [Lelliottia nimipressuralis]